MAETTKTTAKKKTTTRKTTAGTATRKTATRKTATRKTGATATTSTAATKTAPRKTATPPAVPVGTPLHERDLAALLETAGYATTAVLHDVLDVARHLPERVGSLRADVEKAAVSAPELLKVLRTDAPSRLDDLRARVAQELERRLGSLEQVVDGKAVQGRRLLDDVAKDDRVARVLGQTSATRSQVKAALTSVTRTADVAGAAAAEQATTARSQVKGAATSVRRSAGTIVDVTAETVTEAVEG